MIDLNVFEIDELDGVRPENLTIVTYLFWLFFESDLRY